MSRGSSPIEDEIVIAHGVGIIYATPLSLAMSVRLALGSTLRPGMVELVPERYEIFNPKKLQPISNVMSAISGEPAVIYRRGQLEIVLTPVELMRFLMRSLKAREVTSLRQRYGIFEEIAPPFYLQDGDQDHRSAFGILERMRRRKGPKPTLIE